MEHSKVQVHVAHCGEARFLTHLSTSLLSSFSSWHTSRSLYRGVTQRQHPDAFRLLQRPGSCLTRHFWQSLDPFGVSTAVQDFSHLPPSSEVLYAISEQAPSRDLYGELMHGAKRQAFPKNTHRPAQYCLLLGQAGLQGLLLHRRTWIIFERGGLTTSSWQNSITSC